MGYKKILVAFDGSDGSMDALQHGIQHADEMDSELTVIHIAKVSNKSISGYGMAQGGPQGAAYMPTGTVPPATQPDRERNKQLATSAKREAIEKGEKVLQGAKNTLTKAHLQAQEEVLLGDPAKCICEHAQVNGIDLIVIGNRGLSGLKKLVQGSVSEKVTQHAPCPVLVIK